MAQGLYNIEWLDEAASTNDEVRSRGVGGVVVARRQSAGRGQRGNTWSSAAGQNLTFSMLLDTSFLPAAGQFLLSEVVALAVVDALASFGVTAMVKWPNDIYVDSRKIAGILIENDIRGERLWRSVVGVGLNVNQTTFPAELPNPTSMRLEGGVDAKRHSERSEESLTCGRREFNLSAVLGAFLDAFERHFRALERGELPEANYAARLWRRGVEAEFSLPCSGNGRSAKSGSSGDSGCSGGEHFNGTIRGVLPTGELVIDTAEGEKRFLFKEIEFVL